MATKTKKVIDETEFVEISNVSHSTVKKQFDGGELEVNKQIDKDGNKSCLFVLKYPMPEQKPSEGADSEAPAQMATQHPEIRIGRDTKMQPGYMEFVIHHMPDEMLNEKEEALKLLVTRFFEEFAKND